MAPLNSTVEYLKKYFKGSIIEIKRYRIYAWLLIFMPLFLFSCATSRTHFMENLDLTGIKDGTYIGRDSALLCSVRLATTIGESKITDIKILSHYVTYPLAGRAYDIIPKRILQEQSLDVDAVTGATVSSNNIKRAVLDALKKGEKNKGLKSIE